MRTKKISIPIYYGYLVIIVSNDYKLVSKKYNLKENVELYGAFVWTRINKKGIAEYLICVDENVSNHLLAHECTHLVNAIFVHTGVQLDRHNDEPQAYLMGWCFKEIEDFINGS